MWLQNTSTPAGCRVTKIETHKLWCDDFGTTDVEGIDWHGTDGYELRSRHAPDTPGAGGASELSLSASVTMGDLPGDAGFTCTDDDHDYSSAGGDPAYLTGFSPTRCLAGELAFLAVTIRDTAAGDDCDPSTPPTGGADGDIKTGQDPTALCLTVGLDFQKSGAERVGISDLISGDFDLASRLRGDANIDVRFRTGLNVNQSAGFPSVLGKFHLYWGFEATPSDGLDFDSLDVSFDGINLDAGKFISEFLTPIVKQVKKITGPLMPVVETLQGEVPIISDLSKLVGDGPVTVLDVLEAVSGNDLSLLRSILQFVRFVNTLPSDGNLLISLGGAEGGSFDVTKDRASADQPLPESAADGITKGADTQASLIDDFAGDSDYASIDDAPDECASGRGSTFGVCGLTFPFLGDAGQIFGVLMGKDATLVRYDAGTFGAGAGFGFCFPPILIGPVPVQICIGGSFRVEGRFAIGYDTSGLRKVLEGGTGTHLLDGIFIDDYDAERRRGAGGQVHRHGLRRGRDQRLHLQGRNQRRGHIHHQPRPARGRPAGRQAADRGDHLAAQQPALPVRRRAARSRRRSPPSSRSTSSSRRSSSRSRSSGSRCSNSISTSASPNHRCSPASTRSRGSKDSSSTSALPRRRNATSPRTRSTRTFVVRQMESYSTGPNSGKTRFSVTAFGIQQDYFLHDRQGRHRQRGPDRERRHRRRHDLAAPGRQLRHEQHAERAEPARAVHPPRATSPPATATTRSRPATATTRSTAIPATTVCSRTAATTRSAAAPRTTRSTPASATTSNVHGDAGVDNINGGKGADKLFGDADDDIISAGPDNPAATSRRPAPRRRRQRHAHGDGGNDKLWGDEDLDFNCDSDGADTAGDGNNNDTLIGADGNDEMHGGAEGDQLDGGNGDDTMCGGGGPDEMVAGAGKDTAEGGSGDDNMVGGTDNSPAASGGDLLNGDAGRDYMLGDEGTLTRSGATVTVALAGSFAGNDTMNGGSGDDFMWGQGGTDAMNGDANDDEMRGGLAVDTMHGNDGDDEMYGEDADDVMFGDAQNDLMRGGTGIDTMEGNADSDEMYGDNEADVMRGGAADDLMRGGGGDDKIEGNGNTLVGTTARRRGHADRPGQLRPPPRSPPATNGWAPAGGGDGDVIYGDANEDDIVGGSQGTPAEADGGDTILGNAAQDVILGDDGDITRPGGTDPDGTTTRAVTLRNPGTDGGADYIQGNDENDDVYAGGAGDLVHGDLGDDYVEGNGGADGDPAGDHLPVAAIGLYGDAGQDDLIGGTSQGTGGIADGADDIWGGQGARRGDRRQRGPHARRGQRLPGRAERQRRLRLQHLPRRRGRHRDPPDPARRRRHDRRRGAGRIAARRRHDRRPGRPRPALRPGRRRLDRGRRQRRLRLRQRRRGHDLRRRRPGRPRRRHRPHRLRRPGHGHRRQARRRRHHPRRRPTSTRSRATTRGWCARHRTATRAPNADSTGLWKANTFNSAVDRLIALMDVGVVGSPAGAGTSGNDQLLGGAADDTVYGQGGNDGISGGADQDLLEGNANGTGNAPDPAGTYGGSWPAFAGDVIHGDAGADDIAGGTGWIYRMVGGVETADPVAASVRIGADGRLDGGDTLFGDGGGDAVAGDNTVIERALTARGRVDPRRPAQPGRARRRPEGDAPARRRDGRRTSLR